MPPRIGVPGDTSDVLSRTAFALGRVDGLEEPIDLAVDTSSRLLVLDAAGPDVHVFDETGARIGRWAVSGASDTRFFRPTRLAVSGLSILLMDPDERLVHSYDFDGEFQGVALDLAGVDDPALGFVRPADVAADRAGQVFVSDEEGHRVLVFDQRARYLFAFGGFGAGDGQLRTPGALGVTADGALLVADRGNRRIVAFDGFGTPLGDWPLRALSKGADGPGDEIAVPIAVATTPGRATLVADDRGRLHLVPRWFGDARRVEPPRTRLAHRLNGLSALAVHPSARIFCLSAPRVTVEAIELGGR